MVHLNEPCLSEKLSTTELLGEVWFESWCGTLFSKTFAGIDMRLRFKVSERTS